MEFRYRIPRGVMTIYADVFFLEAGRRRVRKMLADYKRSDPDASEADTMKAWLKEKTESCEKNVARIRVQLFEKEAELQEWKMNCSLWKNPFEGRGRLQEAKEALKVCREEVRGLSYDLKKAERDLEAYKKSMKDARDILGFEEGLE